MIKIVDGEIWVNSPSVMMGYYKNPEETAKTLTPDGWLKTGDLGYVDEDGYVFLTGRKKNLIILSNGENVSPEELENKFALNEVVKEIVVYDKNRVLNCVNDDIVLVTIEIIDKIYLVFVIVGQLYSRHILRRIELDTEFHSI